MAGRRAGRAVRALSRLAMAAALVAGGGCGSDGPDGDDGGLDDGAELVAEPFPTTVELTAGDLASLEPDPGDGTLVFAPAPASLDAVKVGSVLVGGVAPSTPTGLLRAVLAVERDGDRLILRTAAGPDPAGLQGAAPPLPALHAGPGHVRRSAASPRRGGLPRHLPVQLRAVRRRRRRRDDERSHLHRRLHRRRLRLRLRARRELGRHRRPAERGHRLSGEPRRHPRGRAARLLDRRAHAGGEGRVRRAAGGARRRQRARRRHPRVREGGRPRLGDADADRHRTHRVRAGRRSDGAAGGRRLGLLHHRRARLGGVRDLRAALVQAPGVAAVQPARAQEHRPGRQPDDGLAARERQGGRRRAPQPPALRHHRPVRHRARLRRDRRRLPARAVLVASRRPRHGPRHQGDDTGAAGPRPDHAGRLAGRDHQRARPRARYRRVRQPAGQLDPAAGQRRRRHDLRQPDLHALVAHLLVAGRGLLRRHARQQRPLLRPPAHHRRQLRARRLGHRRADQVRRAGPGGVGARAGARRGSSGSGRCGSGPPPTRR